MLTDIMLDFETTGTDPEHCAIIQMAAVKFDPYTQEVSSDTFDQALTFAPNRFWQEGGRSFWQKMPDIYNSIIERAKDPVEVLFEFSLWCLKDQPDIEGGWRLWAKPITFEWAFLSSYYRQFDQPLPFHYRYARDLNTYIAGLRGDPVHNDLSDEVPFEGKEHDALWDCFHQIQVLFYAYDKFKNHQGSVS
jgi:RNAse (barnase) inhibitor barstar